MTLQEKFYLAWLKAGKPKRIPRPSPYAQRRFVEKSMALWEAYFPRSTKP